MPPLPARRFAGQQEPDLDATLERLLPDLCYALNAGVAFTGRVLGPSDREPVELEITGSYPDIALRGRRIPVRGILADLVRDGAPKVSDPSGFGKPRAIPGLETLDAHEAIVVCARNLSPLRLVGVCNKANPDLGPYLAPDGRILDEIVELVAVGARIGERHMQELQAIQQASSAALRLTEQGELLPFISAQAAEVFGADAASVMLWDASAENLVIKAHHNLSDGYAQEVRISRERVGAGLRQSGGGPLLIPDLRVSPFAQPELVHAEGVRTALTAPLMANGELTGVLNIYSKGKPREFSEEQLELVMIYANQIAIALENARLFEQARQRGQHWQALYTAAKAITAGVSVERRPVLDRIVAQAVRISDLAGPRPVSGILQLYFPETNELAFESVYPPELWRALQAQMGERRPLDRATVPGGRIGVTGRAVLEGRPQRVDDVRLDPDYLEVNAASASELAAPLLDDGEVVGVLSLESETRAAFDENDEMALTALADLAVIAIRNSAAAEDLGRANAVAMLGAWAADVMHDLNREVGAIRRSAYILQQQAQLHGAPARASR